VKQNNSFSFLGVLLSASSSSAAAEVADAVDLGQLALHGLHDVHVVRDVHVADAPARDEQVPQLGELAAAVAVEHVPQTYVHEGVHVDHAAPRRALVPQVHRGHLALQTLQQDHHAVLRDGALPDGVEDFGYGRRRAPRR